ncbi:MAG: penicillin-binding protein 1C [Elusimicrobia bacterium]|nr:penicillin-binding protein 1C [Elusimicrobiota bacterium]
MNKNKIWLIAAVAAISLFCFSARIFNLFSHSTPLDKISFSQAFYDRDGKLLKLTISDDEKYRLYVPLSQISPALQDAVLLYEDRYFYYHPGVNPAALARGFWTTFVKKNRRMGGSTITMQAARAVYKIDTKTLPGKMEQILCALWLELRYTKKQILEIYLNTAPYAYNIEGIGAASLIYFDLRAQDLDPLSALTLAVVPQNPNARRPSNKTTFENMSRARKTLLAAWLKKYPQDKNLAHFFDMPMDVKDPSNLPFEAPHLINYLAQRNGESEIFTTINLPLQHAFEEEIKNYIARGKIKGINNAAALLVNYKTMEVEAAVGSADFLDDKIEGQVNGFNSKRLIGSTLKPLVYAMAIEQGLIHPGTLLKDTPKRFGIYSPENSDRGFSGPMLARDALVASRNIPAIELMTKIGFDSFINMLKRGGVRGLKNGDYYGIGLAIGSYEVTMIETAALYAALANRGVYKELKFIKNAPNGENARLISPEAAFITLDMLRYNPPPETMIKSAVKKNFPVYFKTGTSSSFKDAWSAAVFGDYVLVTWIGNFNGEGNNYFWGRTAAAPLLFELARATADIKNNFPAEPFKPDGLNVIKVDVCKGTGDLPGKYCPATEKVYFIPGVSPIKVSDVYRLVYIDKRTGLRACKYEPGTVRAEVYEFWPSEIETLFRQAGLPRRPVPLYNPGCQIEDITNAGNPPVILSPTVNVIYSFTEADMDKETIALRADTDSDANTVFWFLDDKFLGKSGRGQTLFMKPQSGVFTVKAVDDLGRSATAKIVMQLEAEKPR